MVEPVDDIEDSTRPVIEGARYRQVLGHFPTGVVVITAAGPEGPLGLAIGSFFSVSLDPPLVGFCPDKRSTSWPGIKAAGHFGVNILADDQEDVCRVFASKGGNKFSGLGWKAGTTGAPRLADVLGWIECDIDAVHDAGDHEICIGRVVELGLTDERDLPLVFYRGGYGSFQA